MGIKKKELFTVTGYLAGIGSLFLITQRTLLAFFSDSKTVTIYVNEYGEQYTDIVALVIIWGICLIGLVSLYFVVKAK